MNRSNLSPEACYGKIVTTLADKSGVARGKPGKKGFGSSALCVNDKIFAMLSSKDKFVVKLPKERVDEVVASGKGRRFEPGRGRVMKEWLEVEAVNKDEWLALAKEARAFVASRR